MLAKNNVQLITYVDRFGATTLNELDTLLTQDLNGIFGGVHLLPFYYPIDGADAGFDPIDHTIVDNRLGRWADVAKMGKNLDIMADMVVNHMSAKSNAFKDVLEHGKASQYWPLFLTRDSVFNDNNASDISKVFRPRPTECFSNYTLKDGTSVPFWTTFTENQIDIDVESQQGKAYLDSILTVFAENNIKLIRLDAAGYAIKKAGTSCFMLEQTFEFIQSLSERASELGLQCLVEIHSHYQTQIEIAKRCNAVYDFALPPLILHTLFTRDVTALSHWLGISPRNCYTVLDTHDGIGIMDVGASDGKPGLLNNDEIDRLVETIHQNSLGGSRKATGEAASNVDLYQVNCTFYDALGRDDMAYLIARAIQFFCPGIPQVYYAGFLACENDLTLLEKTKVGRDINRPYVGKDELKRRLATPVVQGLTELIKLRNKDVFNGEFSCATNEKQLILRWDKHANYAQLIVNLEKLDASIELVENEQLQIIKLSSLITSLENSV
ncbi:sucrose phosphorylase [Aliiglaciecola sp. 3_MG-2023]|uniref:sucrose phosphorylase n=1 Tax=Aliiglaciecola sp. 3_MG-2023 TaxID=3062644 RepID=UPI0026E3A6C8|nr:sucrose phosphorylase [Aliiglaciecola sp. 3_MG-2023]MDO6693735.1 sucrose phosphorylase [Aliiglaciecola sp. 3_MG-2023]